MTAPATGKRALSTKKKLFFSALIVVVPLALIWAGVITVRAAKLYDYVKSRQRGWAGNVHDADPRLGFAPVKGARGAHLFPTGEPIAMRFDAGGFRVPVESGDHRARPLGLALGCSFTYGDACRAEDTWPYLVEKGHGGTVVNAGVCGYGLAQMVLRAEELVPQLSPEFVLVQCSAWLVDRAMTTKAPSMFGDLPNPYFCGQGDALAIAPPVFLGKICELDERVAEFRDTPRGFGDQAAFLFQIVLPLSLHDDLRSFGARIRTLVGALPAPATDRLAVWRAGYGRIAAACTKQGARCLLVIIRTPPSAEELAALRAIPGVEIVDAEGAVRRELPEAERGEGSEGYRRAFFHWRGEPPVLVDTHPNARAHALMAGEILRVL
jgi:hypothetical protein